jgi:hypothetical protein
MKGNHMSKTASIALASSAPIFDRLIAAIDRWLMAHAEMAIRNGDIPRYDV